MTTILLGILFTFPLYWTIGMVMIADDAWLKVVLSVVLGLPSLLLAFCFWG